MSPQRSAEPSEPTEPGATTGSRPKVSADETITLIGARIRTLRLKQGLTLKDVAERTGVSVSMLSMLERGVASASVGTLVSVASALGVHMYDLFDHPGAEQRSPVTRLAEQSVVTMNEGTTRRVAHLDPGAGLELAVNTYEPGGASGPAMTHHDGREFGLLVSGSLSIELEGTTHELKPGDVISYDSGRPHRIVNPGRGQAVAVWVNLDAS
jgi:transcriptional regulator with XRE-family HTH domain